MRKVQSALRQRWKTTDMWLLGLCVLLSCFGCLMMVSCYAAGFIRFSTVVTQTGAMLLGIVTAVWISLSDFRAAARLWPVWVGIGVLLCLLLWTPLGYTPAGSDDRAWLRFGSFSLQPSELLKLAFVYTFSLHLSKVQKNLNRLPQFTLLCLHGAAYTALVMVQGDFGSATVFLAMFVVMIFAAGLSLKFLLAGAVMLAAAVPLVWRFVLPGYLKDRFYVAWDPASDPLGSGYQQYKGQVALGSGQWFGRGLFAKGLVDVPEGHNDFVFAHIGQTLGFAGCVATVLMLVLICGKILRVARKSDSLLGSCICCGVFAILFYQSLVNIGMVLCLIPVIGITLPFVSGGGTSLLISFLGIGMVMSVSRQNKAGYIFHEIE